jgi:FHA domain
MACCGKLIQRKILQLFLAAASQLAGFRQFRTLPWHQGGICLPQQDIRTQTDQEKEGTALGLLRTLLRLETERSGIGGRAMNFCGVRKGGCGMETTVTLTIKNGKLEGTQYEFERPQACLVGRGSDCELRLPSEGEFLTVSRHHCLLSINPPALQVRDCGSRNGTYLNGMQLGHPWSWQVPGAECPSALRSYDLVDGDELRIGDTVFQVGICEIDNYPEAEREVHTGQELCSCA